MFSAICLPLLARVSVLIDRVNSDHGAIENGLIERVSKEWADSPAIPVRNILCSVLFGVDNITIPEDRMASGFVRIILEGLHAVNGSLGKNERSGAVTGRRNKRPKSAEEL